MATLHNHTVGNAMNQFTEQESEIEAEDEASEPVAPNPWTMRILAIVLIVVFLFPLLFTAFQTIVKLLQPQIIPTPFGLDNLLHG
jgi:hypothetical protein